MARRGFLSGPAPIAVGYTIPAQGLPSSRTDAWFAQNTSWSANWNRRGPWGPALGYGSLDGQAWSTPQGQTATSLGGVEQVGAGHLGNYGAVAADLQARAGAQVGQALAGNWLDGFPAQVPEGMAQSPSNTVGAYFRVSWWLATAARTTHSRALATWASTALAKGIALDKAHSASRDVGSIVAILADAAVTANSSGAPKVAQALQRLANPTAIAATQAASPTGIERLTDALPGLPGFSLPTFKDIPTGVKIALLAPLIGLAVLFLGGGAFGLSRAFGGKRRRNPGRRAPRRVRR